MLFTQQHVQVLLSLLIATNRVICSTETFERFNYHRLVATKPESTSQTHSWQTQQPAGGGAVINDKLPDHQIASHIYAPRASIIKPANNQIQTNSFHHQSTTPGVSNGVLHQPGSKIPTHQGQDQTEFPVDVRDQHRQQPQQLSKGIHVNHAALNRPASHDHDQVVSGVMVNNEASLNGPPSNLELALRQVSGDESVFQQSPPIVTVSHTSNFDWFTQTPRQQKSSQVHHQNNHQTAVTISTPITHVDSSNQTRNAHVEIVVTAAPVATSTQAAAALPPVTANDLAKNVTNHLEPLVLDHRQSAPSIQDYYHDHHQQQQQQRPQQREHLASFQTTNASSPIEFNNQVIYEGPVTPPSSKDDYYFSTSERLPNSSLGSSSNTNRNNNNYYNEHANSNAWWAIGVGDEFERVSNLTRDNYREYCDKSPLLNGNKQRSLCRMHPRVMPIVARGLRMAINECQTRFASSRWNCSLILSNNNNYLNSNQLIAAADAQHLDLDGSNYDRTQIFGDVMRHPNRERSFLNALSAAALAHSMTKACRQGELPEECGCDRKIKSNHKGRIEWIGCSDDIDYGAKFSRDFTDNFDTNEPDATKTIYLHNNEVGRRVFKAFTDITCTCLNGENGLCETKRCWKHIGSFADVVDQIMERYESATHVQRSNKDPQKLRPVRRGVRKPKRKDLVYIDESPDYCQQDLRIGVLGTHNRICNSTSQGPDSCSLLCCGRGFQNVVEHIEEDCNCKFVWCCQVKCDKCSRYVTNEICN